jgi:hypothetical protein
VNRFIRTMLWYRFHEGTIIHHLSQVVKWGVRGEGTKRAGFDRFPISRYNTPMARCAEFVSYRPKTILNKHKRPDHWFWVRYSAYPHRGCQHCPTRFVALTGQIQIPKPFGAGWKPSASQSRARKG